MEGSEETNKIIKGLGEAVAHAKGEDAPIDQQKQDATMQEGIQLLLRMTRMMLSSVVNDLNTTPPKASALVMSMLATNLMVYVRGYPREAWPGAFEELATYFNQQAGEASVTKEGEANGGSSNG